MLHHDPITPHPMHPRRPRIPQRGGRGASLWDHPRAPRVETASAHVEVHFGGVSVADTWRACRVVRPGQGPVYFLPRADVRTDALVAVTTRPLCACLMPAAYWHVIVGACVATAAAWSFPDPLPAYLALRDHVAFDPTKMDGYAVDGMDLVGHRRTGRADHAAADRQLVAALHACAESDMEMT